VKYIPFVAAVSVLGCGSYQEQRDLRLPVVVMTEAGSKSDEVPESYSARGQSLDVLLQELSLKMEQREIFWLNFDNILGDDRERGFEVSRDESSNLYFALSPGTYLTVVLHVDLPTGLPDHVTYSYLIKKNVFFEGYTLDSYIEGDLPIEGPFLEVLEIMTVASLRHFDEMVPDVKWQRLSPQRKDVLTKYQPINSPEYLAACEKIEDLVLLEVLMQ